MSSGGFGGGLPSRYGAPKGDSLADILERVLDRGVVIAGDIVVSVLDIELLTLKVRLLIASADTAQQMGIDWWTRDPFLTAQGRELEQQNRELRDRLDRLERQLEAGDRPRVGDRPEASGQQAQLEGQAQPAQVPPERQGEPQVRRGDAG